MAQYTYPTGSSSRTVEAKGDISDVLTMLMIKETPILNLIRRSGTNDIQPKTVEDALSAVNTSNFYAENAAAPAASDTARTLNDNYTQLLLKTAEVTDVQNAVAQYGLDKELSFQEGKKIIEIANDVEYFLVSDQTKQAPTSANSRIAKMAGMTTLITTNTFSSFSQANYDAQVTLVVGYGGAPTDAFMDATRLALVDAWTTHYTLYSQDHVHLEQRILTYASDLGGPVRMHWHPRMPGDINAAAAHFMLIDPALWEIKELLPLYRKVLPDTGAGPATLFKWDLTILCRAEKGNSYFA